MTNREVVEKYFNSWKEYHDLINSGASQRSNKARYIRSVCSLLEERILKKIFRNVKGIYLDLAELHDGNSKPISWIVKNMDNYDTVKANGGLNTIYADWQYTWR